MSNSLIQSLSNAKTRTLALLVGIILMFVIVTAIYNVNKTKGNNEIGNATSTTAEVPRGIVSTPGAKTSAKYKELQEKANIIGSEQAEKKGSAFIPTIVSSEKSDDLKSELLNNEKKQPEKPVAIPPPNPPLYQTPVRTSNQFAIEQENALKEQKLRAINAVAQAMDTQAKAAMKSWGEVPTQSYASTNWESKDEKCINNEGTSTNNVDNRQVLLKAGTILFAVLETAVNSDEPGPIMVKIVSDPLKNSKLIGTIGSPKNSNVEKLTLTFSTISIPTESKSSKINAVAIDPDTARTAISSKVDHHYLLRWGSLFAASFLEGYSKAVSTSGTITQQNTPTGQTTTTTKPALSGRQQIFEGLGEVGSKWSTQVGKNFDRKPTITIDAGVGVGILILADLKLGDEPILIEAIKEETPEIKETIQTSNITNSEQG